jgi:hypothetical protein
VGRVAVASHSVLKLAILLPTYAIPLLLLFKLAFLVVGACTERCVQRMPCGRPLTRRSRAIVVWRGAVTKRNEHGGVQFVVKFITQALGGRFSECGFLDQMLCR